MSGEGSPLLSVFHSEQNLRSQPFPLRERTVALKTLAGPNWRRYSDALTTPLHFVSDLISLRL